MGPISEAYLLGMGGTRLDATFALLLAKLTSVNSS